MPAALRSLSRTRKPAPPNPESDPRFKRIVEQLKGKTALVKKHPPASKKAAEASAAAKGPPNEKAAGAKSKQVDKIKEAPAKKPEPNSFLAVLRGEIQKAMPKTLGDTEKFMKGGSSGQLKGSLKGNVNQQKDEASGGVKTASKQTPSESGVAAKDSQPIPAEPPTPNPTVDGGEAMPAPRSPEEVSLQDSKQDADAQMADAEVTPQQLNKANDPRFSAVLTAKQEVGKQADAAPGQFRANESVALSQAAAKAQGDAKAGAAKMTGVKGGSKAAVLSKQAQQKAKDEKARKEVTDHIEQIYNNTKTKVEAKLSSLETEVGTIFDAGVDAALNAMTEYVESRILNYKLDRYLSIPLVGLARWVRDQFKGLPDEVNVFYNEGRTLFTNMMDKLVVRVADLVERRLKEAKDEVAKGQAEIAAYVAKQPKDLQSVAQAAQKDVAGRFEELERGIEDKKNQLAQQLAAKYKEAFDKADAALKKIQDANKGLVAAFIEKLGEIIKILAEFKDKLMGLLRKGWETIKLILADPIGFLGNLIAAIKQGVGQFVGNITAHLKRGFMAWLFGALAEGGIQIPKDLTLPSILKLVLDVLGITYERMRAKAVKLLGPTAVFIIEKVVEYVGILIKGGPAALWEKVKEDLSNLKEMVIDAIQSWLIDTVVKSAATKLLSMFNPAGAFVQAIMLIYNTVMFLIENASKIMAFVEAVINSVHAIATGAIGGAANWIEQALARTIPLVIGFLARLIGLGGIGQKIKEFITKVQNFVDKAIDKAIAKVVAWVKKMFGKLTGKKDDKPDDRSDTQKQADVDAAIGKVQQLINKKTGTPAKEVQGALPAIQSKHRLTSLKLVQDGQGKYHVEAEINPKGRTEEKRLLSDEEEAALAAVARSEAALIKADPKARTAWNKDHEDYFDKRVSGKVTEEIGKVTLERYARQKGYTVLYSLSIELYDKKGEVMSAHQAEVDAILVGLGSVQEIVDVKFDYNKVSPAHQLGNLSMYYRGDMLSITPQKARAFGSRDWTDVRSIGVRVGGRKMSLADFQSRYPRTTAVTVVGLSTTPEDKPVAAGRLTIGTMAGLTQADLKRLTIDEIKKNL